MRILLCIVHAKYHVQRAAFFNATEAEQRRGYFALEAKSMRRGTTAWSEALLEILRHSRKRYHEEVILLCQP